MDTRAPPNPPTASACGEDGLGRWLWGSWGVERRGFEDVDGELSQMQCWRTLKHEEREPGSATQRSVDSCKTRLASR